MTVDQAGGPLAGLLVADFSRILAGPYATMLLADMGAEVVKVEGPGGDDTRTWQPPVRDGISTYYLGVNRNKRSIALDLRDAGDLAAARELARRADVFIENFKPGGLARFGLDYEAISAANPAVVYASISGFGSGPGGAALPGYDLIVQAISGLMSVTGDPDGEPYRAGVAVFDVISGLHATIGILAALNHRHETGQRAARRDQPAGVGDVRPGEPDQRLRRRGRGAVPDGQQPPQPVPLRAAALRRRRTDHHRGQRPAVPQAGPGPGRPRAARRPAVQPQRGPDGQPRPAAAAAGRAAAHPDQDGVVPRADRGGGRLRADQHHRPGRGVRRRRSGSTRSSAWGRATPRCRRCATRSPSPRPRPATGCRRLPWTSTAPRSAAGWPNQKK